MLGQAVFRHLSGCGWRVTGTQHSDRNKPGYFDAAGDSSAWEPLLTGCDYAINCIGILARSESVTAAIRVNALFPHLLAERGVRVIHISTDGVFAEGGTRPYLESDTPDCVDHYGRTKVLGECPASCVLNIRCSIIGRDKIGHKGLLEWLDKRPGGSEVQGYINQHWNGVTTLQYAQLCEAIIAGEAFDKVRAVSGVHHFCPNPATTKYGLLKTWCEVTGKRLTVKPVEGPPNQGRLLGTEYPSLSGLFTPAGEWLRILSELAS